MKCCICGKEVGKFGHNPYPVRKNGKCCSYCNDTKVIPARIELMK
jgi:hypothetical protein